MEVKRFYTSPVNHHNLGQWADLSARLERAVRDVARDVSVELGAKPVFSYETDARAALDAESHLRVSPRHVRIDLWSSIVLYETIGVTFGSDISGKEAATISSHLERGELSEQAFLREVGGRYDIDTAQVYGYAFTGGDEDLQDVEWLLETFDTPLYIGARRCLLVKNDENDENATVDDAAFDVFRQDADVAVFIVKDDGANDRLWSSAFDSESEGLIALFAGDEADNVLVDEFSRLDDLRILLADKPSAGMRITLGRCHADDSLLVVYTPPEEPDLDQRLLFVI